MGGQSARRAGFFQSLALLCLLALFVCSAAAALMVGAGAYNGTAEQTARAGSLRTALAYIAQQTRQGDFAGGVARARLFGGDALVIRGEAGSADEDYCTYIYCYGGFLREVYTEAGLEAGLAPEGGSELVELDALRLDGEGVGLIRVKVSRGGESAGLLLSLRSGEAERP